MPIARFAFSFLAAFAATTASANEDWSTVVIGNPSQNAPSAFSDSFVVAEALESFGFSDITLKRDLSVDAMATTLEALSGKPRVFVYFSGPIGKQSAGPTFMGAGGGDRRSAIGPFLKRLAEGGTNEVVLLVEDCAGGTGMAGRLADLDIPQDLSLFLAASAGPEGDCTTATRLTDQLAVYSDGGALQDALSGVWVGANSAQQIPLGAHARTEPNSTDISVVGDDVIILSAAAIPVAVTDVQDTTTPAPEASSLGDSTVIFVPPPTSQIAAIPTAEGLPEPSIIVGLIDVTNTSFSGTESEQNQVDATEIGYDNLDARLAFKSEDPELFRSLVEGGAFDPPEAELARALQTELQRMGCYRSTIDGIWGGGSRNSVSRYFSALDQGQELGREPTVELFRQIILNDDVECAAPVATTAARPSSNRRPRGSSATPTRRPPQPTRPRPTPPANTPTPNFGGPLGGVLQ